MISYTVHVILSELTVAIEDRTDLMIMHSQANEAVRETYKIYNLHHKITMNF